MRAAPDGPRGQALGSPLMVDLAQTIHAASAGGSGQVARYRPVPSRTDVEHLLKAFLLVAYEERPVPPGFPPRFGAAVVSGGTGGQVATGHADGPTYPRGTAGTSR